MSDIIRSINIMHTKLPNVSFRVGVFTPHQMDDADDPKVIIELNVRNNQGVSEVCGSLFAEEFIALARDIAGVCSGIKSDDKDG